MDKFGSIKISQVKHGSQVYKIDKVYSYVAVFHQDEGDYWVITFPAIPEALTQATTEHQIDEVAADALETAIVTYLKLRKELP